MSKSEYYAYDCHFSDAMESAESLIKLACHSGWKFLSDFKSLFWKNGFRTTGSLQTDPLAIKKTIRKKCDLVCEWNKDINNADNKVFLDNEYCHKYSWTFVTDMITCSVNVEDAENMMRCYKLFLELSSINIIKVENNITEKI